MDPTGYRIEDWGTLLPGGALLLNESRTLVVADMHLGYEAALEYEGMSIPRVQTKKIERYMDDLLRTVRPTKVIVAGDLKHNFSRDLIQEYQDIEHFVQLLKDRAPLECVKGNHDNFLNLILRECNVPPLKKEIGFGHIKVVHGHQPTELGDITIMGHMHPSIRLRDNVGASVKDHCYLWHPQKRILVLPALSILAAGMDVVLGEGADTMSPLFGRDGLDRCLPIVFSGERAFKFPSVGELRQST